MISTFQSLDTFERKQDEQKLHSTTNVVRNISFPRPEASKSFKWVNNSAESKQFHALETVQRLSFFRPKLCTLFRPRTFKQTVVKVPGTKQEYCSCDGFNLRISLARAFQVLSNVKKDAAERHPAIYPGKHCAHL